MMIQIAAKYLSLILPDTYLNSHQIHILLGLGAIQKILVKIGGREGSSHLTRGREGSWNLTRDKFLALQSNLS
jgi:hypothetical protein